MYKGFYSYGITFQKNIETIETSLSTDYKILLFSQFPDHARNSFLSTLHFFLLETKNILNMDKEILIQKKNKESSLKYNELIKKCD